jgi:hypothetical protein
LVREIPIRLAVLRVNLARSELDKAFASDATTAPYIMTAGSTINSVFELSLELFGGRNNTNDLQENTDERSKR